MKALEKYLNEHLAGSDAAVHLLTALAKSDPSARAAYEGLRAGIQKNRLTLETVIQQAGCARSSGMPLAARLTSGLALLRFRMHGLEPGGLGLVEALEALELGVHGQTLLWRGLAQHQSGLPAWQDTDFAALLRTAEDQKAVVERLRSGAVHQAFFREKTSPLSSRASLSTAAPTGSDFPPDG